MATIKEYTTACLSFAKDSRRWESLEPGKFYTTAGSEWAESWDNANGGIDLSWAFHRPAAEIRQNAAEEFIAQLLDSVEQGADEGFDREQWQAVLDRYR